MLKMRLPLVDGTVSGVVPGEYDDSVYSPVTDGTITTVTGLLGQYAAKTTTNGGILTSVKNVDIPDNYTTMGWFKFDAWSSLCIWGTRQSNTGFMTYRNSGDSVGLLRIYNWFDTNAGTTKMLNYGGYPFKNLELDTWYHMAISCNSDGVMKAYLNGELKHTKTAPDFKTWNRHASSQLAFGSQAGNGYLTDDVAMNDVRYYDHECSAKEIKEASLGKILHWDFNQPQYIDQNCSVPTGGYRCSCDNSNGAEEFTITTTTTAGSWYMNFGNTDELLSNTSYVFSLRLIDTNDPDVAGSGLYITSYQNEGVGDGTKAGSREDIDYVGQRVQSVRNTDSSSILRLYPRLTGVSDGTPRWYKFEKLVTAKGVEVPAYYDGQVGNEIRDTSGFGNVGIIDPSAPADFPAWTSDSKFGGGSYYFNGSNKIKANRMLYDNVNQNWTLCAWVKIADTSIANQHLNEFNHCNAIVYSSTKKGLLYINSGTNDSYVYSSTMPQDTWIHLTYVLDTSIQRCQIYKNGVLDKSSTNYSSTDVPIGFSATETFGSLFKGWMDDVRVYGTALSDADIKALYETRASLSDQGELFCAELDESFLNEIDGEIKISIAGTGNNSPNRRDGGIFVDDVRRGYRRRGMNVYVFDRGFNMWAQANFDLYSDDDYIIDYASDPVDPTTVVVVDTADEKFIEFVNEIPDGYLCGFYTYDSAYTSLEINAAMADAFGADQISKMTHSRDHYTLLAEKKGRKFIERWKDNATTTNTEVFPFNFNKTSGVRSNGVLQCNELSEVGPTEGLVGYWDFSRGDAKDLSGNGIDGTSRGAVHDEHGLIGGYYSCGDIAGKADLTKSTTWVVDFTPGTTTGFSGATRSGLMETHYSSEGAINFTKGGNFQWYKDSNGSSGYYAHSRGGAVANERQILICTYAIDGDGTATSYLWLNGNKSSAVTRWDKVPTTHNATFNLGNAYTGTFCDRVPGSVIRSIRIYDRALTDVEVMRLNNHITNSVPMSVNDNGTVSVQQIKEV